MGRLYVIFAHLGYTSHSLSLMFWFLNDRGCGRAVAQSRMLDSRPKGRVFEPRKTHICLTERLLLGCIESNQKCWGLCPITPASFLCEIIESLLGQC